MNKFFSLQFAVLYFLIISVQAVSLDSSNKSKINLNEHPGELCNRSCEKGVSKICYFEFHIEFYQAMGNICKNCANGTVADCDNPQCIVGDGRQKGVMSINRQIPGPAIQVCIGDYLVVDVINKAPGTAVTIHWHGLRMEDAKFMDGVPFVTQCPISSGTSFRYQYEIVEAGTFFYHAHTGLHKANGLYGALILREPQEDNPMAKYYDYDLPEHNLVISDWLHNLVEYLLPGIPRRYNTPDAILLNGRGTYVNNVTRVRETAPPPRILYVEAGKKYRFRFISALNFACLGKLQIQSHSLSVIATDGHNILPMEFESIIFNSGERYDFVIETNQDPGDYWIRLRGTGICGFISLTEAFALLRYKTDNATEKPIPNFPDYNPIYEEDISLNSPNQTCNSLKTDSCVTKLKSIIENDELRDAVPDHIFYIGFDNYIVNESEVFNTGRYDHFANFRFNELRISGINHITLMESPTPLLSQPDEIDETKFCDDENLPSSCKGRTVCPCLHRLYAPLNSIVEMVFVDETQTAAPLHHPIHLHGYHFMVTDLGQHPNEERITKEMVIEMDKNGTLARDRFNRRPPMKDTVSVPSYGYAIVRFKADNPGYWFLHCHDDFHMTVGMALVFQVGNKTDMPKPPENFPKCGNYLQDVLR